MRSSSSSSEMARARISRAVRLSKVRIGRKKIVIYCKPACCDRSFQDRTFMQFLSYVPGERSCLHIKVVVRPTVVRVSQFEPRFPCFGKNEDVPVLVLVSTLFAKRCCVPCGNG